MAWSAPFHAHSTWRLLQGAAVCRGRIPLLRAGSMFVLGAFLLGRILLFLKKTLPVYYRIPLWFFFAGRPEKNIQASQCARRGFTGSFLLPVKCLPAQKKKKILGAFFPKTCFYKPLPVKCLPVRIFFYWEPFFFYWELFLLLLGAFFHAPQFKFLTYFARTPLGSSSTILL